MLFYEVSQLNLLFHLSHKILYPGLDFRTDNMPNKWQILTHLICVYWTFVNSETFPMLMPNVKPQLPKNESYLCTGTATDPTQELYITGFEPRVTMNQAHHLMVIGCSNPMLGSSRHNLWNCGGTLGETSLDFGGSCQGGDMQVSDMF